MRNDNKVSAKVSPSSLVYLLISIGVALQISGSNWDIVWHGIGNVESFFTPPHSIIYSGVALAIGSLIVGIIQAVMSQQQEQEQQQKNRLDQTVLSVSRILLFKTKVTIIPLPLKLATIGIVMQLSAGPFDFWWHNQFGFDGLLSPPHSILAAGMLMASLGALIGLCGFKKYNSDKLSANTNDVSDETNSPVRSLLLLAVPFSVFWMVSIGIIFMFTLPFSKGQYFDFNPNPVAAIIANATLIPFVTAIIFFVISVIGAVGRTSSSTTSTILTSKKATNHIPFIFTVITAYVMIMQLTTTIISNPYFIGNIGLYLLNILPAIVCDILLLKYRQKIRCNDSNNDSNNDKNNKYVLNRHRLSAFSVLFDNRKRIVLTVTTIISIFYITLFYPWSFDLYKHYFFGLDESVVMKKIADFQHLLWTAILPIIVPTSIIMSIIAGLVMDRIVMPIVVKDNNIHTN